MGSLVAALLLLGGCGAEDLPPPSGPPPDSGCVPGELLLESGECQLAGVPPEACAEGFVPDGNGGCNAILPAEPCPPGQMAVPGETSCREVAPCGDGPWGTIPLEATTQFVDEAYAGADSDGTMARPWTTVQQGVDAAAAGAIVAVTDGVYDEDVRIEGKAVRLWGRCPGRVEIRGTGVEIGTLEIFRDDADGTEIRGLAVTGVGVGIAVVGASDVRLEQVWVHDAGDRGIDIENVFGPTSVTVQGSLVEQSQVFGVFVGSSDVELEATVARGTQPLNGELGMGIAIQDDPTTGERARAVIRGCVIEQNHGLGVSVGGSDAELDATVVRTTQPLNGQFGMGISIPDNPATGERAKAVIRGCVVEQNHDVGVFVAGSDAELEATVVRHTQPVNGQFGMGIGIQVDPDTGERANAVVRGCVVEQNHQVGIALTFSDVAIEATAVRDTAARADGSFGDGITLENGTATIQTTSVSGSARAGVANWGSDVTILSSIITCNQFDINGETHNEIPASFDGSADWQCSRAGAEDCTETDSCHVLSAGLAPPPPLDPLSPPPQP